VSGGDNIPKFFAGESFSKASAQPDKTENTKIEVAATMPPNARDFAVEPIERTTREVIFEKPQPSRMIPSMPFSAPIGEPVREDYLEAGDAAEAEGLRLLGEAFSCYILAESKDGQKLFLVDKHAAHERILFERLKEEFGNTDSQALLVAQPVMMSAEEQNAALQNAKTLHDLGFEIEDFGDSVLLRQVPTYIGAAEGVELLRELAEKLAAGGKNAGGSDILDDLLHITACKAAIKAGKESAPQALLEIVKTVLTDPRIRYCPHGRPVLIVMTKREFDRRFGRI